MAQDLAAAGVELPALMNAGRWKELPDAGALHREAGGGPGCRGQVLSGERRIKNTGTAPKRPLTYTC